jgi:predicted nucleic acid-binding protein
MIVVDASVVSFLLIEGELTDAARALHALDPEWITPPILNHEMLTILAALGGAEGRADQADQVERIWRDVRNLAGPRQQIPDPVRSMRLAVKLGIPGHQAQYLCLADSLNLALITEEEDLLRAAPDRAMTIIDYLERRSGER